MTAHWQSRACRADERQGNDRVLEGRLCCDAAPSGHGAQFRVQRRDTVHGFEKAPQRGGSKALRDDVIDQSDKGVPEPARVQNEDGLVVQPDLTPGQYLEKLVERARSAGQDNHGIRIGEHHLLALVHCFCHH